MLTKGDRLKMLKGVPLFELPLVTDNPTMARKVMQTLCARLRDVQKASLSD